MANIETIIPFILYSEAGGAPSCFKTIQTSDGKKKVYFPSLLPPEKQFEECRKRGFANDPVDRGGATMCGVTFGTYSAYCNKKGRKATVDGLKAISYADWREILQTMYWNKWKADEIKDEWLAVILVDWVWASGITGIKRPQKILGVTVDGIVGPKTLAAVNAADPKALFDKLHADRLKHFQEIVAKTPSQVRFLKGWNNRVNMLQYGGFKFG